MRKWHYIWLSLILLCVESQAQHRYRLGLLPQINLNEQIASGWKINAKIESRQLLKKGHFGQPANKQLQYERTDISTLIAKKTGANSSLAAGLMIRFQEDQLIQRTIQQYAVVRRHAGYRLGHRFSTDQTFAPQTTALYRFRYRIGADVSLNGESVDPREFYFKVTNEYLGVFQGNHADIEIRLSPTLGYAYTDNNKAELGLDYRADAIRAENFRSSFWIIFGWYVSIK